MRHFGPAGQFPVLHSVKIALLMQLEEGPQCDSPVHLQGSVSVSTGGRGMRYLLRYIIRIIRINLKRRRCFCKVIWCPNLSLSYNHFMGYSKQYWDNVTIIISAV